MVDDKRKRHGNTLLFWRICRIFPSRLLFKRYPDSLSLPGSAIIAGLGVVILLFSKHYEIEIDFYRMFWYLSIFVVALSVTIWKSVVAIVKRVKIKETKLIARLSNLSFGILLMS